MTRALIAVRLSNLTDETTSPQRQEQAGRDLCASRGWEVVDVASDLDVSAAHMSPFERPSIRKWLDRPEEYDVLVFWKMDRFLRRTWHFAQVVEWAETHNKNVVSATESHIDLSTAIGRAIANIAVTFAEMEWEGISARSSDAFKFNLREGKYRGGHPPWGYIPEKKGVEWRLVPWAETKTQLIKVVDRILEGESPSQVCADLNDRGVMTPHDMFRVAQGKKPVGSEWKTSSLIRSLRSPTLLGQVVSRPTLGRYKGKAVYGKEEVLRGDDGTPVVRCDPLIDTVAFNRLQQKLDGRIRGPINRKSTGTALLLRVIYCGNCGRPFYRSRGRSIQYYRCASWSKSGKQTCPNGLIQLGEADNAVESILLESMGDAEMMMKVYEPGEDTAQELADVDAELTDVAGLIGTGPFKSGPAREKLEARAEALSERRDVLASTPFRPAGYTHRPTGKTVQQHWGELDAKGRNLFLRDHDVKMVYTKGGTPELDVSIGELIKMMRP